MKKIISSLLLLFFIQQASARSFYDQLCEFNFNWKKYENQAPKGEVRNFKSDQELIQAHLTSVLLILKSNSVPCLNSKQLTSRMHLIEVLDEYRVDGLFPMNYYREERIPVFIDEHNTHCAVGFLIQETGNETLAQKIALTDNYAWIKDINVDGVTSWQQASGFSMEELKLIQGAYDFYEPMAFTMPNKHEIPQKPACITAYFENKLTGKVLDKKRENIWCYGEGSNGVLNGRWEQNYSVDIPWIVGFFSNGKRTGQWKEYYQGTKHLCRTENWRNNKLNGVRKRFNREGVVIEEIMFVDGEAVTKINYDFVDSLTWIRTPLDSNMVWTEVFTFGGSLIASGHEKVHNPGNLLWFQNIELTALNSASITSRDASVSYVPGQQQRLFSSPPLVQYNKEGTWKYFKEYGGEKKSNTVVKMMHENYRHFGDELYISISMFDDLEVKLNYDSISINYSNNVVHDFYGYGEQDFTHLQISYHQAPVDLALNNFDFYSRSMYSSKLNDEPILMTPKIKEFGQINQNDMKFGIWKHYDQRNQLYKTENFILPRKEENIMLERSK